jgi:hypothetical protein
MTRPCRRRVAVLCLCSSSWAWPCRAVPCRDAYQLSSRAWLFFPRSLPAQLKTVDRAGGVLAFTALGGRAREGEDWKKQKNYGGKISGLAYSPARRHRRHRRDRHEPRALTPCGSEALRLAVQRRSSVGCVPSCLLYFFTFGFFFLNLLNLFSMFALRLVCACGTSVGTRPLE